MDGVSEIILPERGSLKSIAEEEGFEKNVSDSLEVVLAEVGSLEDVSVAKGFGGHVLGSLVSVLGEAVSLESSLVETGPLEGVSGTLESNTCSLEGVVVEGVPDWSSEISTMSQLLKSHPAASL